MNREKSFFYNVIVLGIGKFFSKALHIITLPIITLSLNKNEYGMLELISTLTVLCVPMVTLQIHSATFRFLIGNDVNDKDNASEVITNTFAFVIPIAVVASIILYFLVFNVQTIEKFIISLYFFLDVIYSCLVQIICGFRKEKLYSISSIIIALIFSVTTNGMYKNI